MTPQHVTARLDLRSEVSVIDLHRDHSSGIAARDGIKHLGPLFGLGRTVVLSGTGWTL